MAGVALTLWCQTRLQQTTVLNIFFSLFFQKKIRPDISCESTARQRIHMKHQTLVSSNDKSENAAILLGALRVNKSVTVSRHQLPRV